MHVTFRLLNALFDIDLCGVFTNVIKSRTNITGTNVEIHAFANYKSTKSYIWP